MILPKKSNNFEYWLTKAAELFGLDWKSWFKMDTYSVFYLLILNSAQTCKNGSKKQKISQNAHYSTVFDSIQL